ncbi:PREDICTED: LOC18777057 [Prunus dulcis]|uniref:PREDICTED: LOC18777057 n=1 Tax=Prunus dulcis TaxID=3755 RepID=A0A5E4GGH2_PRUDU|nr:PREDICTED: LOC18777057 [Prunus dulcis]
MLSRTPFLKLTEAYMKKRFTKEECQKSNRDIVRLIKYYDLKTKQFQFGSGDNCQITSRDMAEIFGLPNKGKKLPSTTTSTRMSLDFVKTYFTGAEKITKTTIDKCLDLAFKDETKKGPMDVTRLIILQLFMTNLFCNFGSTLAWTYITMIDNWAHGVLDYTHFGLEKTTKNKKDKKKQLVLVDALS